MSENRVEAKIDVEVAQKKGHLDDFLSKESNDIAQRLSRRSVQKCEPYIAPARDYSGREIYLDANENPYAMPISLELMMNRYPDSQPEQVIARYAEYLGVDQEEILATLGGDSAIELLIKAFCEPKEDKLLYLPPTFGMYQVTCDLYDVETVMVPLREDFSLDLEALLAKLDGIKMLFLCSPNNPTGNVIPTKEIEAILEATRNKTIVVLDEAYIEFSDQASFVTRVKEYPHLALVRTLSKAFALAGIRMGFVVADRGLIDILRRVIAPYPLPVPAIAAAEATLTAEGIATMKESRAKILKSREALKERLAEISIVERIYPSAANFLLVKVQDSQSLFDYLSKEGIFVRYQSLPALANMLRISVGLPEENDALIAAMNRYAESLTI
ncbi:histidinol-phosphate transaminase [Ignatzschineria sp. F8392]|uniref:histidinol-phosphate transaminase n=1 Tax=Ignatzschineria sp. F8392 TaxID=1980117 RepID=UPI000B9929FB|nr:histidinol-phosphate transaminase [Ignatzschineria sp. F8392]OYQ78662.1 histidinol-phosphate transaminase [Ignatzschineria sp. F8392]